MGLVCFALPWFLAVLKDIHKATTTLFLPHLFICLFIYVLICLLCVYYVGTHVGAHDTQCLCGNQRTAGVSVSHFSLWVLGIVFEWPDTAASALPTGPSHQPLVSLGIKAKNEA